MKRGPEPSGSSKMPEPSPKRAVPSSPEDSLEQNKGGGGYGAAAEKVIDLLGLDFGAATSGVSMMASSDILRKGGVAPTPSEMRSFLHTSGLGAGHLNSDEDKSPTLLVIKRGSVMKDLLGPNAVQDGLLMYGSMADDGYMSQLRAKQENGSAADFEVYSDFKEKLHKDRVGAEISDCVVLYRKLVTENQPPLASRELGDLCTLVLHALMLTAQLRCTTSHLGVLARSRAVDSSSRRTITITVPFQWDRVAHLVMDRAAVNAGLSVSHNDALNEVSLLHEPTAALQGALMLPGMVWHMPAEPIAAGEDVLALLDVGGHTVQTVIARVKSTAPLAIKEILDLDGNYDGAKEVDKRLMGLVKVRVCMCACDLYCCDHEGVDMRGEES